MERERALLDISREICNARSELIFRPRIIPGIRFGNFKIVEYATDSAVVPVISIISVSQFLAKVGTS